MSRVVWTEHRPKLEISNRPASWTDQLDHRRFNNEDGCRHHQQNLKVEAPHFHPQEIDGHVPVQSVPISTPKTLTPQGLLPRRLRPSKGVQSSCSEVTPWHMIWNATMAGSCGKIHVLHFKRWKNQPFFCPKRPKKARKCRRRLPRLWAAAGAHCSVTRKSVGERSWWQNKWWKSMERWGIYGNYPLSIDMATRYIIYIYIYLYNDI